MEGTMTSGAFTGATLAEKLNKLNPSQQSIETLSHWCIFHRKKAKDVVETWAKKFHEAPKEQRVPFLYLANDILQNSRRKGPEFVNEFWTVLPRVLRDVVDTGDETVRSAAYRLVDIWEERRVFGSRAQSLREELLGKRHQAPKQEAKQSSLPPYQVFEGSMLERVARSYHAVQEKAADEFGALSKCSAALSMVETMEKEAEGGSGNGGTGRIPASITEELLEQEAVMRECIEQLEGCEMSHALLCSHLKDALLEQESKLEEIRTHLQIAQAQLDQAGSVHHRLVSGSPKPANTVDFSDERASFGSFNRDETANRSHENQVARDKDHESQISMSPPPVPLPASQVAVSMPSSEPTAETTHAPASALTVAAEVAAKLAASSSSAAMLTSVLSSLAAEEANGGVHAPSFSSDGGRPLEKRPRLEGRPESLPPPDSTPYQLSPPLPQYLSAPSMMPMPYSYQSSMPPPPPPIQGHMMMNQHPPMGLPPPQPMYQPFQAANIPFYSQPPLPAPPAPAPRQ